MKICIIGPSLKMGGMERASVTLANKLSELGHEVSYVALFKQSKFLFLSDKIAFFEPDSFNLYKLSLRLTVKWIRNTVNDIRPDNIIVFNKLYSAIVLLSLFWTNNKIFISERSSPLYKWPLLQEIFCRVIFTLKKPAGIIAQTKIAAAYQKKYYGKKIPIAVIPNIIRSVITLPDYQRQNVILATGRLNDPLKGFDLLLESFALIQNKDWHLWIAGGIAGEDQILDKIISSKNIGPRVKFLGKVTDIDKVFSMASIFVIPSRSEGFPNALCEAMAAGLACIAFDFVAGPNEIIQPDYDGIIVKNGNIQALSDSIDSLILNPKVRERLGNNAKQSAKRFSSDVLANQIINFLQNPYENGCDTKSLS